MEDRQSRGERVEAFKVLLGQIGLTGRRWWARGQPFGSLSSNYVYQREEKRVD